MKKFKKLVSCMFAGVCSAAFASSTFASHELKVYKYTCCGSNFMDIDSLGDSYNGVHCNIKFPDSYNASNAFSGRNCIISLNDSDYEQVRKYIKVYKSIEKYIRHLDEKFGQEVIDEVFIIPNNEVRTIKERKTNLKSLIASSIINILSRNIIH